MSAAYVAKCSPVFGAALLWLVACGASGEPVTSSAVAPAAGGHAGAERGGGAAGLAPESITAGAGGGSPFVGCDPSELAALAVKLDTERACLETEAPEQVGCVGPPHEDGTACLERIADGVRFWLRPAGTLRWDSSAFRPCAATPKPPACFNRQCGEALLPSSFCTPAETRKEFACGSPGSAYDAACCARQPCTQGRCPAGFRCAEILKLGAHACSLQGGACMCVRTPGGQSAQVCVEDEE